jgi:hypothetical protein
MAPRLELLVIERLGVEVRPADRVLVDLIEMTRAARTDHRAAPPTATK